MKQYIFLIGALSSILCIQINAEPTITARKGDITKQKVDAIVNAANPYLKAGAGVCGAIFKAAGKDILQKACKQHRGTQGVRCPVGEARITDSGDLKNQGIKYVIHTVGPDGRKIKDPEVQKDLLKKAYTASLTLADKYKLSSIAFPFISSGIYAIDQTLAAKAAIGACKDFAGTLDKDTTLQEIAFVLFSQADHKLFTKLLEKDA